MANQSKLTRGCWQSCPPEVLCEVIKYLDPISLIRLSQTSSFLRQMIRPEQREWTEFLLAIECTEEYGGGLLVFQSHNHFFKAERTDKRWQGIRWACIGCMKLLTHTHFDNHSLLKLRYRKPIPGTPAADGMLTSWTLTLYGKEWGRKLFDGMSNEQLWHRRHYGTRQNNLVKWADEDKMWDYSERLVAVGINPFRDADEPTMIDFIRNVEEMGLDRWGTKRHLRKCNECQYQANQLGSENVGRYGSAAVPIQTSRKILFVSALERFLPGYLAHIEYEPPRGSYPIYVRDPFLQSWSTYMVRCPGCQRWQELRAFRFGSPRQSEAPELGSLSWDERIIDQESLQHIRCNACFVQENGKEILGFVLSQWFQHLVKAEKGAINHILRTFFVLWQGILKEPFLRGILGDPEEMSLIQGLIEDALEKIDDEEEIMSDGQRVVFLQVFRFCEWVRMRLRWTMVELMNAMDCIHTAFDKLLEFFEDYQARWKWLHSAILEEALEDKDALAEWVLSRDGAALT